MTFPERQFEKENLEGKIVLSGQDARAAARLLRVLSEAVGHLPAEEPPPGQPASEDELASLARIIFHSRRTRARHFKRAMFGEPAWDVLLLLYAADRSGSRQTLTKLAGSIEAPLSTVNRWIGYLEREQLVQREPHPTDRRVVFIGLLPKGRQSMTEYLTEMGWRPS